jgi:aerobic-type carbon monoxide dehydrogenase small subunit (CoxS/CutS family)
MIRLTINQQEYQVDVPDDTPLLWVIREELGLTGTKFGCGKGLCGACTVILGDGATRSCVLPVIAAVGMPVTTIEGLALWQKDKVDDQGLHGVQRAWIETDVVQCGYCQSGQILAAAALLKAHPVPSDAQIDQAMVGNLCRCGTYPRIRAAIKKAAEYMGETPQAPINP